MIKRSIVQQLDLDHSFNVHSRRREWDGGEVWCRKIERSIAGFVSGVDESGMC